HHPGQGIDRGRAGRQLRAAAEAGSEPRLFRLRGRLEEYTTVAPRRSRPADRTAIDAGRLHAHEEQAVEARVPGHERPVTDVGVQRQHALTMPVLRAACRPFSDPAATL